MGRKKVNKTLKEDKVPTKIVEVKKVNKTLKEDKVPTKVVEVKKVETRKIDLSILLNSSYVINDFNGEKISLYLNGESITNNIFAKLGKYTGIKTEQKNGKLIVYTAKNSLHSDKTIHSGSLLIVLEK